jgi:hypothetical protein
MDKELTVPKLVLIVRPKIPQMPQNLSAQFVCPSPKVLDFNEKKFHWASIVREKNNLMSVNKVASKPVVYLRPKYSAEAKVFYYSAFGFGRRSLF